MHHLVQVSGEFGLVLIVTEVVHGTTGFFGYVRGKGGAQLVRVHFDDGAVRLKLNGELFKFALMHCVCFEGNIVFGSGN